MDRDEQQPSGVRYVDPFRDPRALAPISAEERTLLRTVNQKIAARPSLRAIVDYLFERTQPLIPCDRIGLAFIDERRERVTSYFNRASYPGLRIDKGYSEALLGSSLADVLRSGMPRIIDDLELYLKKHPRSRSTSLLVKEGIRSSLTCPLSVEGRVVGFVFRSSRQPHTYSPHHIELQMAIAERLSQAVEKAWRIEQLEESNHAYAQMLGFVSHQLKSPMASIVTDAQLLAEGYLGDLTMQQRSKVEGIARKGELLLGLAREYLDLARVDGGDPSLTLCTDVDLNVDIIAVAVALVAPQMDSNGMRLSLEQPDPSPTLTCDISLLRIVLVNLLDNAVKYGKTGGEIHVSATMTTTRRGSRRLQIGVWNEGLGFSPADRNKLFRRFSRLEHPGPVAFPGTGLGLYNAWRIVQLHQGRFSAESEQGEWARFTFEIPADPAGDATSVTGGSRAT